MNVFLITAVLDTAAGVWCDKKVVVTSPRTGRFSQDVAGGDAVLELTRRCRHAAASVGDLIYMYGGLRGGTVFILLLFLFPCATYFKCRYCSSVDIVCEFTGYYVLKDIFSSLPAHYYNKIWVIMQSQPKNLDLELLIYTEFLLFLQEFY